MNTKIIAVQFKHAYDKQEWGGKEYHYLTNLKDLKKGDLVVVETQHGYSVAQVVRYISKSSQAFRYIIQKVDVEAHEAFLEKEMKLAYIQAEIEERAAAVKRRRELEALAEEDEKLNELIIDMDKLLS